MMTNDVKIPDCKNCTHKDVCTYNKNNIEELIENVEHTVENHDYSGGVFTVAISCKYQSTLYIK